MKTQVILFVNNDEACLQYCREIKKNDVQLDVTTELT